MDKLNKSIGSRIKKYRKSLNLSTTEVSKLSGISQGTISKIENGYSSTNIATLIKICNALEITLFDILPDDALPNIDELEKRRLITTLNQMSENEIKTIHTLLSVNIMPLLKNITPLVDEINKLTDKERESLKKFFDSITNKHH
ncbi:helix-turn-helix transcriptional regulator [Shouchella clausii]|uniref:helix-turn-helix domain-containing protein n=1 Tax=Bacteria TaxID=2 RepID=UPI00068CE4A9|nr:MULTISPECIES: helix-turn-helix transcriptional regulator [Bacteria]ALA55245.1 hypothetical protein DB29_0P0033 [Shouchella clausii]MBU3266266.1 helix-turn-helix transcriptional regulator [Shouchella clausii]MBU3509359.1 helix-turn-helix transcriptional regulator [Shouchella clausii]MDP0462079.1 helix-turn-helix transcriptional regulator [Shouchella rhizosphaerae]MDP5267734.1 helix-turn-helix transcriptional regulator [Shouchella clausii]